MLACNQFIAILNENMYKFLKTSFSISNVLNIDKYNSEKNYLDLQQILRMYKVS